MQGMTPTMPGAFRQKKTSARGLRGRCESCKGDLQSIGRAVILQRERRTAIEMTEDDDASGNGHEPIEKSMIMYIIFETFVLDTSSPMYQM